MSGLKFHHTGQYNVLQKLAYGGVLFVLFPAIIHDWSCHVTRFNALVPFLKRHAWRAANCPDTSISSRCSCSSAFFVIHMVMILAAGPINELRSIITGWYRTDPQATDGEKNNV